MLYNNNNNKMEQSLEISCFNERDIDELNFYVNSVQNTPENRFYEATKFARKLKLIQDPYECNSVSFISLCDENLDNITKEQITYFNTLLKCVNYPFFINENVEFVRSDSEKFNNIELHTLILVKLFRENYIPFEGKINCESDSGNFTIEFDHRNFCVYKFVGDTHTETFETESLSNVWNY